MKLKKTVRALIGANVMLVMTFALLPALIINPDVDFLQSFMNYLNKE